VTSGTGSQAQASVPRKSRLTGVDAARGLALLAMMAIHIMPAWNDDFEPTLTWTLFAGHGVALFALLAGLSLALSSGGVRRPTGPALSAARAGIAVRAGLIMVLGLLLGYLDIEAEVILAYYGVMFLLALPLLQLSARTLTWIAGFIALVMPFVMQGVRDYLPATEVQPNITGLFTHFVTVAGQLLFTGVYPVLPWMAYICAGLAIGRLDLRSRRVQTGLLACGCGLALLTTLASSFLLGPGGGGEQLEEVTSGPDTVEDILIFGPDPALSTDSWWWLATLTPYSSAPLDILNTIGLAVAVLAACLLLGQRARLPVSLLTALGSMTLTLYTGHLLLLATGLLADVPGLSLAVQIVLVSMFALIWRRTVGQGPLERLMGEAAGRTRNAVLARKTRSPGSPARPAHVRRGSRARRKRTHGHHRAEVQDSDPPRSEP
jgi:uncharacterized membrane protein